MRITKIVTEETFIAISRIVAGVGEHPPITCQNGVLIAEAFPGTPYTRFWDCVGNHWNPEEMFTTFPPHNIHRSNKGRRMWAANPDTFFWGVEWRFLGVGSAKGVLAGKETWLLEIDFPRPSFTPRCLLGASGNIVPNRTPAYTAAFRYLLDESAMIGADEGWEGERGVSRLGLQHYHFSGNGLFGHLSPTEKAAVLAGYAQRQLAVA